MMTLENIRDALKDRKLSVVARKTGLHYNVVHSFASGRVKNPSYETVIKLTEYIRRGENDTAA